VKEGEEASNCAFVMRGGERKKEAHRGGENRIEKEPEVPPRKPVEKKAVAKGVKEAK